MICYQERKRDLSFYFYRVRCPIVQLYMCSRLGVWSWQPLHLDITFLLENVELNVEYKYQPGVGRHLRHVTRRHAA